MVTAVGSFPHKDPEEACEIILRSVPEIPVWPQLPNVDFREQMEIQYSEGMPRAVVDEASRKMYFDTSGEITGDLEEFYENVLAGNLEYFKISPAFSRGIYRMEEKLSGADRSSIKYFKNQVTGPITFGLNRVDENKRSIYYNEIFRDVVVKGIAMKTRWLLRRFSDFGFRQICFVDEPIFSAFGSSTYVSVQRPDVVQYLKEVIDAIHDEGAIAGSHCCGNTEWTILIDAGVDIISFDAYEYGETIGYYPDKVNEFLEKGGVLAWGIVPTSEKINDETPESIIEKLEGLITNLAGKGLDENLIWDRCLITPSCGTGSRPVELAEKTFRELSEVGRLLRR
jgi:methionine synthase II (cobalamin-independent)